MHLHKLELIIACSMQQREERAKLKKDEKGFRITPSKLKFPTQTSRGGMGDVGFLMAIWGMWWKLQNRGGT